MRPGSLAHQRALSSRLPAGKSQETAGRGSSEHLKASQSRQTGTLQQDVSSQSISSQALGQNNQYLL